VVQVPGDATQHMAMLTQPLLQPFEQCDETQEGYESFLRTLLDGASGHPNALLQQLKDGQKDESLTRWWHNLIRHFVDQSPPRSGEIARVLAELMQLAPEVGAKFLEMTLKQVSTQTTAVDLSGVWMNDPMRCVYTRDEPPERPPQPWFLGKIARLRRMLGYEWKSDVQGASDQNPNMHATTLYQCVLPNILNLDIIQALSNTRSKEVFAKKSVQGLLYCTYQALIMQMCAVKVSLGMVEMLTLLAWAMTPHNGSPFERLFWMSQHDPMDSAWLQENAGNADAYKTHHIYAYNSSCNVPCTWHILAALSLKAIVNALWKCVAIKNRRDLATQRFQSNKSVFGTLRRVWGIGSLIGNAVNLETFHWLLRCSLLYQTAGNPNSVMTSDEQFNLCVVVITSSLSILSFCRVIASECNLSRMAIRQALRDREVTYFAFFVATLFSIFVVAWLVIDRKSTLGEALIKSFRALIIGDGDGLDYLSLRTEEDAGVDEQAHKYRFLGGTVGMIIFFSYLMNLLIVIFGNTYDRARKRAWLDFNQDRAKMLKDSILSYHKFSWADGYFHTSAASHKLLLWMISIGLGVAGHIMQRFVGKTSLTIIQASSSLVSVVIMAAGGVLLESLPFLHQDDWFPWQEMNNFRSQNYLYFWCRSDFDEGHFLGTDEAEQKCSEVLEKIAAVDAKVDDLAVQSKVLEKIAAVDKKVEDLVTQTTRMINSSRGKNILN